jgi:hypothetical protein
MVQGLDRMERLELRFKGLGCRVHGSWYKVQDFWQLTV